ncbi:MAG TPA: hypothetical protein VE913_00725 [Longimicrobium sp.]|nr:hypothetical protein [Longimicrobium sp.]
MPRWLVVESAAFILDLQEVGPPGYGWADSILGAAGTWSGVR